MPHTKQHRSLGTRIIYTAGLPDHAAGHDDCDADFIAANRHSILTASFSDIPIDILVASDEADSAQVVQKLEELRKDGRRTSRHTIFITATQQTGRQHSHDLGPHIRGAYGRLNNDYPVWYTNQLSHFQIREPPYAQHQTAPIESRFRCAGMSMELHVFEFPTIIQRQTRAQPFPLDIPKPKWRVRRKNKSNTVSLQQREQLGSAITHMQQPADSIAIRIPWSQQDNSLYST